MRGVHSCANFFMDKICGRIDAKQEKPENRKTGTKAPEADGEAVDLETALRKGKNHEKTHGNERGFVRSIPKGLTGAEDGDGRVGRKYTL